MIDQAKNHPGGSARRGCRVLGLRRQTYQERKGGKRPEEKDQDLQDLLRRTTQRFIAWGFWMIFHFLRNEYGLKDNHKRVYRLWKAEGLHLRVPARRPRMRREYQELLSPKEINRGWAMDFVSDWVLGPEKESVRIINIMDECSRRALWTQAHYSISARKLITVLDQVVAWRGIPEYIRCDNGPEFIAHSLAAWAERNGVELRHIQPGKPSQNGLIERLNKTLRLECLNLTWFTSLESFNEKLQDWSVTYNELRPHQNLSYKSPMMYESLNKNFYFKAVAV